MNLVGRIFIFLTLVLSVLFMSMAVMVYATHKNWRLAVERTAADTPRGEQVGLKHQLEDQRKLNVALQEQKTKLEAEVTQERLEQKQALAKLASALSEATDKRDSLQKERDKLFQKDQDQVALLHTKTIALNKATDEVESLRKEIVKTQQERDKQFAQVVDVTDKIHQAENELKRVKEREQQVAAQYAKLKELARRYGYATNDLEPPSPLRGKVVAISADDLVEVSIGADDGLKVGNTLEVFRGSTYLGRVEVLKTDVDHSVAKIMKDFRRGPIQKGDDVATRLKLS